MIAIFVKFPTIVKAMVVKIVLVKKGAKLPPLVFTVMVPCKKSLCRR